MSSPSGRVDFDDLRKVDTAEIASEKAPGGEARPPTLPELGLTAFKWVILGIGVGMLLLSGFAVMTYPRLEEVERVAGQTNALTTHGELVAAWFSRVKDMGQVFILTPLLPLLGLILGYIFGRAKPSE